MIKISTIIPTYNRKALLAEAVESWNVQKYVNKELIIIDDASKPPYGDEYLKYKNVKVFHHLENHGVASAMNHGIKEARGEIIHILQDDDLYYDEFVLLKMSDYFQIDKQVEVLWGGVIEIDNTGKKIKEIKSPAITPFDIWNDDYINLCSMFWKKSIHDKIGYFSDDLISNEDWEFEIKCLMECICYNVKSYIIQYRRHIGNKSTRNAGKMKEYEEIFKARLRERYKDIWTVKY